MSDADPVPYNPFREERVAKCAEDNPDLTKGLIEEILVGLEELDGGESSEYRFG